MPAIKLFWLGSPKIEIDGKAIRLEIRKATALIAYLSVPRHNHSREFLAALLWPEYDQERAHANLRQCILHTKKKLGPGLLSLHRESVGLAEKPDIWLDVEEFNRSRVTLGTHLHDPGMLCDECVRSLEHAVDIYRGDFLEGFNLPDCPDFDMWQLFQRDDFSQKLSRFFERLVEWHSAAHDLERGIEYTRKWLWFDRCNEAAHRTLMLLYSRSGQRPAAIRQYTDCVKLLKEELGVVPEARTQDLYEQIRHGRVDEAKKMAVAAHQPHPREKAPEPFVAIKLSIPRPQGEIISRPNLRQKLDNGLQLAFTLISAPPGFGKTTLLVDWANLIKTNRKFAVSWFSVDQSDNDPVRFLSNLSLSIGYTQGDYSGKASTFLQTIPAPSVENMIERLTHDLQKRNTPTVVVLDDYHLITNTQIHRALQAFIHNLPHSVHLFLSTRSDPPIALSRFRSHKLLAELHTEDLRFTGEEIELFFNNLKGLNLSRSELHTLKLKTEGWAVGLQIAAHLFGTEKRHPSLVRSFGGGHKQIMDYLAEEVLDRQSRTVKEFLIKTSILDQMNDSLCRAVTGYNDCQGILEKLERSNLFIVPLDDKREWYRYHNLFADVLRLRQKQFMTEIEIFQLHKAAARWYNSQNLFDDAVRNGLSAQDYPFVTGVITRTFMSKLAQGELSTLQSWLDSLPKDVVYGNHELCVAKIWILILSGLVGPGEELLMHVKRKLPLIQAEAGNANTLSHIAALNAYIAESKGEDDKSIELALDGIKLVPEGDFLPRWCMLFILGRLYRKTGNLQAAEQTFIRITEMGNSFGIFWMQATGVCDTANIMQIQGRLSEASELCRRFLLLLKDSIDLPNETVALVYLRFADTLYERNKLKEAKHYITLGLNSIHGWTNPNDLAFGYIELIQLQLALRNLGSVRSILLKAEELKEKFVLHAHLCSWISICRIKYELSAGNHLDALRLSKDLLTVTSESPLLKEFLLIEYYQILIRCAEFDLRRHYLDDAIEALDPMIKKARSGKRMHRYIQLVTVKSIVSYLSGNTPEALSLLQPVLMIAELEGYVRTFLDEGESMKRLLSAGIKASGWNSPRVAHYVSSLIKAFDVEKDSAF